MNEHDYLLIRKKIKYLIINPNEEEIEKIGFAKNVYPILNDEQILDISTLMISKEAIELFMKLFNETDNFIKMDYSFDSIAGVQYIIDMLSEHIDLEQFELKKPAGEFYNAIEPYYKTVISSFGKKNIVQREKKIIESFILYISRFLGAYLGECLINEVDNGLWKHPKNASQLSSLRLIKNGYSTGQDFDPVSLLWHHIMLGDKKNIVLIINKNFNYWNRFESTYL